MISDQEGLNKSYNTADGLYEDTNTNTLFIAGTRNMNDVLEWPKIPTFRTKDSAIYGRAKKYLDEHPNITNLVGHSYGGSAALQFRKDNKNIKLEHTAHQCSIQFQGTRFINLKGTAISMTQSVRRIWAQRSSSMLLV